MFLRRAFRSRAGGSRSRGRRLVLAALALGAFTLWVGVHRAANSPAARERLRARAERLLRDRLGEGEVGDARIDWLFRAELGPVVVPGSRPGGEFLRIARVVVRPRLLALLLGRIEPGAVTAHEVRLEPGPGGAELGRAWRRLRARQGGGEGAGRGAQPSLALRRVTVVLDGRGGRPAELGPVDLDASLTRDEGGRVTLEARLALPAGGHASLRLDRQDGVAAVDADVDMSLPGDLPAGVAGRLPVDLPAGQVRLRLEGRGDPELRAGAGQFRGDLEGFLLSAPWLGPSPVGPFAARSAGTFQWDRGAGRGALTQGRISLGALGAAAASVEGTLAWLPEPRISLSVRANDLRWSDLLSALPEDLRPPEAAPQVDGPLSARLDLSGPLHASGDWTADVDLDLEELRRVARARPNRLLGTFRYRPADPGPGETAREIVVGPGGPGFVPLAELPPSVVRAVTASEDAGFFAHRGFDFQEIARALVDSRNGRVRGASTITQQVAKNLYLSPDRTVSRKVREALATVALEAAVPKARLLEIYLNIAEWGPGVYGIGEAARFWFGKDARELSPKEGAFLASVIPSPKRFAARLRRAGVSPWWQDRISDILGKMWIQGQLTDEQLNRALDEPLDLRLGPRPAEPLTEPAPLEDDEPSSDPVADPPEPTPPR